MSASKWRQNILDVGLVGYGASCVARLPGILFGQFFLTNTPYVIGSNRFTTIVRPTPPGVYGAITETNLPIPFGTNFPYGFEVEPDV